MLAHSGLNARSLEIGKFRDLELGNDGKNTKRQKIMRSLPIINNDPPHREEKILKMLKPPP